MYMYCHFIIHTFIDFVFWLEAACSKNKDDINLMDFLVFCFSYFDHQIGSGLALPTKQHGHAIYAASTN